MYSKDIEKIIDFFNSIPQEAIDKILQEKPKEAGLNLIVDEMNKASNYVCRVHNILAMMYRIVPSDYHLEMYVVRQEGNIAFNELNYFCKPKHYGIEDVKFFDEERKIPAGLSYVQNKQRISLCNSCETNNLKKYEDVDHLEKILYIFNLIQNENQKSYFHYLFQDANYIYEDYSTVEKEAFDKYKNIMNRLREANLPPQNFLKKYCEENVRELNFNQLATDFRMAYNTVISKFPQIVEIHKSYHKDYVKKDDICSYKDFFNYSGEDFIFQIKKNIVLTYTL